jgi:replication fork protection complex subunit Csm3/Swi3
MLNMYQLWLDDLYPRAKFADALTIIEKVGHTKRMQMMRKDWIDEGKPRRRTEQDDEDEGVDDTNTHKAATGEGGEQMEGVEQDAPTDQPDARDEDRPRAQDNTNADSADADPDDDELDALLAESAEADASVPKTLPVRTAAAEDDPFADEMEAMADMDDMW